MTPSRILGVNFDHWPPELHDMHFNKGGKEHLVESDYEQANAYGKEIGKTFADEEISLGLTLGVVAVAFTESALDLVSSVQQTAFFRGVVESSYTMPRIGVSE